MEKAVIPCSIVSGGCKDGYLIVTNKDGISMARCTSGDKCAVAEKFNRTPEIQVSPGPHKKRESNIIAKLEALSLAD